ncbi:BsuPI-related putative proteinase inhibitor [Halomarina halobia]|uniref:Intracellular proteinase inhibitor BsuPI domain-containing protein n=1 Tax=Halomarina halobia TaxID=3033386 RepID=A0ABD6AC24_9EURY|nr:BsuPI-related putative proteinase inhibitor [Halomarina sp. PSR21]
MLRGDLRATVDEGVTFAFTVENTGDEPVSLTFADAARADFVVDERWRWSDGRLFAQVLGEETLAPGESRTYEGAWSDPEPGTHEARAELLAREQDCEARTRFEI